MSLNSPDIQPKFNRRDFGKLSLLGLATITGVSAFLVACDRAIPNLEATSLLFPEELQQTLEDWMANQYYDHDSLKPLEDYAKRLYETSPGSGWTAIENKPSIEVWVGESKSPELLQDSGAVFFKVNDELRGFIWNDYATFSLQGTGEDRVDGILTHFSGGEVENYEGSYEAKKPMPSETPIPFLIVWLGPNKFQGWIDFRGHTRPFGGGKDQDSFPQVLMWKGN